MTIAKEHGFLKKAYRGLQFGEHYGRKIICTTSSREGQSSASRAVEGVRQGESSEKRVHGDYEITLEGKYRQDV